MLLHGGLPYWDPLIRRLSGYFATMTCYFFMMTLCHRCWLLLFFRLSSFCPALLPTVARKPVEIFLTLRDRPVPVTRALFSLTTNQKTSKKAKKQKTSTSIDIAYRFLP
jgi:hypothetical protein